MKRHLSLLLAAAAIVPLQAQAEESQRFVMLSSGEKIGTLNARVDERDVRLEYSVSSNGRGPKIRETMKLDPSGLPVEWTIDGQTMVGAPLRETFRWRSGKASWSSQADAGVVDAATPPVYIGNDASPWALGIYARALLAAPGKELSVLPAGRMKLRELGEKVIGQGAGAVTVRPVAISGLDMDTLYLLLDTDNELFATEELVREGHEALFPEISAYLGGLGYSAAEEAHKQLAHRYSGPVRIRNVRIFDPRAGALGPLSDVVIFGERISEIYPAGTAKPTSGETVIEGEQGTLVPGLVDMHHHISMSSTLLNLAAGVTGVRDMGNDNKMLLDLEDAIEHGRISGPRMVRAGLLEGRSPYSTNGGRIPENLPAALEDVRWYADRGYSQIKIYNSFPPDWVGPVAAEAHRLGLGVTGHVPAFSSPERVIREGYDDIAHVAQLLLTWVLPPDADTRTSVRITGMYHIKNLDLGSARFRDALTLMKQHGTALDTTLMVEERLMLSRARQINEGDLPYLSHVPINYQRYRKRSFMTIKNQADEDAYQAGFAKTMAVVGLLDQEGIQLLPGTDDFTGFSMLRELELYVKAGITPAKALYYATLGAAEHIHRDRDLGTLERGKLADFFLVPGDPTKNISTIRSNRMTVKGGTVYFPDQIYKLKAIEPFASAPAITTVP